MIGNKSKVSSKKSSSEIQSRSQDFVICENLAQKSMCRQQDSSSASPNSPSFEEQSDGCYRPVDQSQHEEVVARDDERCEVSNQTGTTVGNATPFSQKCRAYPLENKYQNLLRDEQQRGKWNLGNCVRIADMSSCLNGQSSDRKVRAKMDCQSRLNIGQQEGHIVPQDMFCYKDIQNLDDSLRARKASSPTGDSTVDYRDLPRLIPVLSTCNDPKSQTEAVNVCAKCGNHFSHIGFAMHLQEARNAGHIPNNRVSHGSANQNLKVGNCGSCYAYYSWFNERLRTIRSDCSPGSLSPNTVRYQDDDTVCSDQYQAGTGDDTDIVLLRDSGISTATRSTKSRSSSPIIQAHQIASGNLPVERRERKMNIGGTKNDPCGIPPAKRLKSDGERHDRSIDESKAAVKEKEEKDRKRLQYIVSDETRARLQSAINQTAATRGLLQLAAATERHNKTDVNRDSGTINVVRLDDSNDDPDCNFFEDINRIMSENNGEDDKGACFVVCKGNNDRPTLIDREDGVESKGTNESNGVAGNRENITLNSVRLHEDTIDEISKKSDAEPLAVYIPPSQMIKVLGLKPGEAMDVTCCMGLDSLKKLSLIMNGKESFVADPYKGSDRRKQDFEKIIEIISNMYGKGSGLTGEETKAIMKTEAFLKEYIAPQHDQNEEEKGNKSQNGNERIKKEICSPDDSGIKVSKNFRNRGAGTVNDPVIIDEAACPDEMLRSSHSVEVSLTRPLKRRRYASDISFTRLTNIKKEEPSSDVQRIESPTDGQVESTMGHTASDQKGDERFGNKDEERLQSNSHAEANSQVHHTEFYKGVKPRVVTSQDKIVVADALLSLGAYAPIIRNSPSAEDILESSRSEIQKFVEQDLTIYYGRIYTQMIQHFEKMAEDKYREKLDSFKVEIEAEGRNRVDKTVYLRKEDLDSKLHLEIEIMSQHFRQELWIRIQKCVCGKVGQLSCCSRCKSMFYCGKRCQVLHKEEHDNDCK